MSLPPPLPPGFNAPPPLPGHTAFYPRPPKPRRWGLIALISAIAFFVLLAAGSGGWVLWQLQQRKQLPPLFQQTSDEKYAEASAAFSHPDFIANDPTTRGIRALFDRIGKDRAAGDAKDLVDCSDLDRQLTEIERRGFVANLPAKDRADLLTGMNRGAITAAARLASLTSWKRYQICHVHLMPGGREAVVYVHEWRKAGYDARLRYWVRKEESGWRYFDNEDLDDGTRASTFVGLATQETMATHVMPPWIASFQTIMSVDQMLLNGKEDQAETSLKSIDSAILPPQVEASRQIAWASLDIRRYRYADALAALDKADAQQMEAPMADELRASALNHLGRYQEAIDSANKYISKIGDDPVTQQHLGDAYEGLKDPLKAAVAYRKGLDLDPDSFENLRGLRRVLPAGDKAELGVRLSRCGEKHIPFSHVAADAIRVSDLESLQALVNAYGQTKPDDVLLDYYSASVLGLQKHHLEAAQMLKANYPRAIGKDREVFNRQFIRNMIAAGDPLRAYQQAPQSAPAFRQVATALLAEKDLAQLRKLIAQRRVDYPSDYWIDYYEGILDDRAQHFSSAAASYFKALDAATVKEDSRQFRYAAVRASFNAGNAIQAYQHLASREVFEQLGYLYSARHDAEGLNLLLNEALTRGNSDDTDVAYWKARIAYLKDDFAPATALLGDVAPKLDSKDRNHWRVTDLLVRCLVRQNRLDEALTTSRAFSTNQTPPTYYAALVAANRGDVTTTAALFDQLLKDDEDYDLESFYTDPEMGTALRSPAFAHWRDQHPEARPQTLPSTQPANFE